MADTSFAYLTQEGTYATGAPSDVGWFAGYLLIAAAACRPAAVGITWVGRRPGRLQVLLPYCPPGPGRGHLGHHPAPRPGDRSVPLPDVRGPGPADRRPPAPHRARQPGPQPPAGRHGRGAGAPGLPRRAHQPAQPGPVPRAGRARPAPPLPGRHPLALLVIDLDDFKTVNDQLGHATGDDLLVAVASRLETCLRDEDTVARLGGDEVAILLEQAPSHEVAVRVAGRILEAMRPPFPLQGRHIQVGASVGVTVSDATEVDAGLGEADVAMYLAKARGKGRFELATAGGALDTVGTIPETRTYSPRQEA